MAIDTLLIGGRGTIGSGLRRYLPEMDERYRFCSIDLPGAPDRAKGRAEGRFVDMDIVEEPERFRALLTGVDLVVYLARQGDLAAMNRMTDLVFESVLALDRRPLIVGSSSVHAVDDAYRFFESGAYALIAERQFDAVTHWPPPISAHLPACPINDYGHEKAYVETWVERAADRGCDALATRWGGVNTHRGGTGVFRRLVPSAGRGGHGPRRLHGPSQRRAAPCAALFRYFGQHVQHLRHSDAEGRDRVPAPAQRRDFLPLTLI